MLAAGNSLPPVNVQLLVGLGARTDAGFPASFYLRSVVADIADSGLEILGHPLRAGEVRSVIKARRRYGNRDFIEAHSLFIELIAQVDFFVHRSSIDQDGVDRMSQSVLPLLNDLFRLATHSQSVHPPGGRKPTAQHRAFVLSPCIDHVLEKKCLPIFLADPAAKLP